MGRNSFFNLLLYHLVICYIAIENGPVEIVDLPINSMVDLSIVFCMFTRGFWKPRHCEEQFFIVSPWDGGAVLHRVALGRRCLRFTRCHQRWKIPALNRGWPWNQIWKTTKNNVNPGLINPVYGCWIGVWYHFKTHGFINLRDFPTIFVDFPCSLHPSCSGCAAVVLEEISEFNVWN